MPRIIFVCVFRSQMRSDYPLTGLSVRIQIPRGLQPQDRAGRGRWCCFVR